VSGITSVAAQALSVFPFLHRLLLRPKTETKAQSEGSFGLSSKPRLTNFKSHGSD